MVDRITVVLFANANNRFYRVHYFQLVDVGNKVAYNKIAAVDNASNFLCFGYRYVSDLDD